MSSSDIRYGSHQSNLNILVPIQVRCMIREIIVVIN